MNNEPRVIYSFGDRLAGGGTGRPAGHAVAGTYREGLLKKAVVARTAELNVPRDLVETVPLGSYLNSSPSLWLNRIVFDYLTSLRLDSAHIFHGWNTMCLQSLRKAKQRGMSTVVERASTHPRVKRDLVKQEYKKFGVDKPFLEGRLFERAITELQETDYVFVPSDFAYESFIDEGWSESQLHKIRFGVNMDKFRPPTDFSRGDQPFQAVFVGQVSLRKGIQYLLPAWQQADIEGELLVTSHISSDARSIVDEYRDDPSIRFLGWVDDLAELYRRSNVFVFPSIEEGSALVSYEAMASGLPSIVTPNAGSLVKNEEHGIVVPPRDVDAITDALERLATDSDLRNHMGQAARKRIKPYTWKQYGEAVSNAYRNIY